MTARLARTEALGWVVLMATQRPSEPRTALLSPQVSQSRYFFFHLGSKPTRPAGLAFGGREHCNPDYHLDRPGYAYHVLEYVAEGTGTVELNGQRYELVPGSIFASQPSMHCVLRTDAERPLLKYFLCASGRGFESRLKTRRIPIGRAVRVGAHGEIRNVFEQLIREGRQGGESTETVCGLLLEVLLLKIADAVSDHLRPADLARENFLRCKALIDAQAERIHSLDELAAASGLEASSVCRLFRRFQGTSPYQYLLRCKMNLAAEHLLGTGMLIKEAAQRVGFADAYHFSRCFKAVHGVSPRDLRKRR